MDLNDTHKSNFINVIKKNLSPFSEINKIILFGSFTHSSTPNDIDIAVIQDSNDNFLSLSLKYRKVLRDLSKTIPVDIIPIKNDATGLFIKEINKGKVIYER